MAVAVVVAAAAVVAVVCIYELLYVYLLFVSVFNVVYGNWPRRISRISVSVWCCGQS